VKRRWREEEVEEDIVDDEERVEVYRLRADEETVPSPTHPLYPLTDLITLSTRVDSRTFEPYTCINTCPSGNTLDPLGPMTNDDW
jgi:hypothetical protein